MLPVALPTRIADLPAFTARVNAEALRQTGDPAAELDVLGYSRSSHTHDIVYQEFRTNHLMHKLYSEWALGASADRLKESYDGLLPVLEPLTEPAVTITKTNLRNHLGQHKMYGAYLQFFDEEIRQHGLDAVFRTYYPSLLAGMFGGLFHPLIHLGYALEFRNELLLGEGFAYACSWYRDLGAIIDETSPQDIPRAVTDPWQALQVVAADVSGDFTADAAEPEFETRLCGVLARPRMIEKMTKLVQGYVPLDPVPPVSGYSGDHNNSTFDDEKGPNTSDESDDGLVTLDVLHRLKECTVAVYADLTSKGAHLDFYLAHTVTSLIATFMILPYLDDPRDRVRQLRLQLFALLGVYTVEGRGDLPRKPTAAVSTKLKREASEAETVMATATPDDSLSGTDRWMDIRSRAILANDDHVAKVVRALDFFRMLYGDPDDRFYRAALRTVDDITVADDWRFHALPSNASKS